MENVKILIVDDEIELREIIEFDFESAGFTVFSAENGRQALILLQTQKVDVIVSDIRMPLLDGVQFLKEVRLKDTNVPMVFITGFADVTTEDALNFGIDAVFFKPFDRRALLNTVKRLLTPKNIRWRLKTQKIASSTQETINLDFESYSLALKSHKFNLARGGMFIELDNPAFKVGQNIYFKINFKKDPQLIFEGNGIVRWIRSKIKDSLRPGIGVEFSELTQESISWVLQEINEKNIIPLIPKG